MKLLSNSNKGSLWVVYSFKGKLDRILEAVPGKLERHPLYNIQHIQ